MSENTETVEVVENTENKEQALELTKEEQLALTYARQNIEKFLDLLEHQVNGQAAKRILASLVMPDIYWVHNYYTTTEEKDAFTLAAGLLDGKFTLMLAAIEKADKSLEQTTQTQVEENNNGN